MLNFLRPITLYKSLCDLTHPGASSVWMWLSSENGADIKLSTNQDDAEISFYLAEYRETFLGLMTAAFNPAIVTLNVLNYFPKRELHTPALLEWDFSNIPLWEKCQSELRGVTPFTNKGLRLVKQKI